VCSWAPSREHRARSSAEHGRGLLLVRGLSARTGFGGAPAWFGRSTLQWWALAGSAGLVTAPSARELAGLLRRLSGAPPIVRSPSAGNARQDASQGTAAISTSDQVLRRDAPRQEPAFGPRNPSGTSYLADRNQRADSGSARGVSPGTTRSRPDLATSADRLVGLDDIGGIR